MCEKVAVFKVTLCIVDFDGLGSDEIRHVLENARYPNQCLNGLSVKDTEMREVDWTDDHPLNYADRKAEAFRALFDGDVRPRTTYDGCND